jgi:tRNA-specific 2-thiouridylase
LGLVTHDKKDSTGICFIGERNFRAFLKTYLGNQSGDIKTLDGKIVGRHEGLMYYTIGQRKGLGIGGVKGDAGDRWFVIKKDLQENILYVHNGDHPSLYSKTVTAANFNWITPPPAKTFKCTGTTRYRQANTSCKVEITPFTATASGDFCVTATFDAPVKTAVPGQWLVLYLDDVCLGGGEIVCTRQ